MVIRALSLWRQKYEKSSLAEKFRRMTDLFMGAEYVWGKENILECDCSGLICGALIMMGYNVRVTATQLKEIVDTDGIERHPDKIHLIFFIASEDYDTPSGRRSAGTVRHVGIVASDDIVLHASHPKGVAYERIEELVDRYNSKGCYTLIAPLNWNKVRQMEGKAYGLDEEVT